VDTTSYPVLAVSSIDAGNRVDGDPTSSPFRHPHSPRATYAIAMLKIYVAHVAVSGTGRMS
jgi:hypothetical protein